MGKRIPRGSLEGNHGNGATSEYCGELLCPGIWHLLSQRIFPVSQVGAVTAPLMTEETESREPSPREGGRVHGEQKTTFRTRGSADQGAAQTHAGSVTQVP